MVAIILCCLFPQALAAKAAFALIIEHQNLGLWQAEILSQKSYGHFR
jgi:hypothetical protein